MGWGAGQEKLLVFLEGKKNNNKIIVISFFFQYLATISKCGQGPTLYGNFKNGYVYSFTPGVPLEPYQMPQMAKQIAKKLALWHSIKFEHPVSHSQQHPIENSHSNLISMEPKLFKTLHSWLNTGSK